MRGWSPLLEWNWYLKVGRQFEPRTVLLFFFWNDSGSGRGGDEVSTVPCGARTRRPAGSFRHRRRLRLDLVQALRLMRLSEEVWTQLNVSQLRRAFSTITGRSRSNAALDAAAAERLARSLSNPPLTDQQLQAVLTRPDGELDPALQAVSRASFWPSMRPWPLWTGASGRRGAHRAGAAAFCRRRRAPAGRSWSSSMFPIRCRSGRRSVRSDGCSTASRHWRGPSPGVRYPGLAQSDRGSRTASSCSTRRSAMRAAVQGRFRGGARGAALSRADCHWSPRGHQFMADYLSTRRAQGKESGPRAGSCPASSMGNRPTQTPGARARALGTTSAFMTVDSRDLRLLPRFGRRPGVDGEIVAAAQEERFTRQKARRGLPGQAVDYCLAAGGLSTRRPRLRRLLREAAAEIRSAARDLPELRAARASRRSRGRCRCG